MTDGLALLQSAHLADGSVSRDGAEALDLCWLSLWITTADPGLLPRLLYPLSVSLMGRLAGSGSR